jgi:hypothetical protein
MNDLGLRDQVVVLTEKVDQLEKLIEKLVTKHEFEPVRMIAYGLATAVLTSVMMAILAKVIIT